MTFDFLPLVLLLWYIKYLFKNGVTEMMQEIHKPVNELFKFCPHFPCGLGVAASFLISETWPRGYKLFFILNSIEHEICPAHKC